MPHHVHRPQFSLDPTGRKEAGCVGMIRDAAGQSADVNAAAAEQDPAELDSGKFLPNISHNFIVFGAPSPNDFAAITTSEIPEMKAKEVRSTFSKVGHRVKCVRLLL